MSDFEVLYCYCYVIYVICYVFIWENMIWILCYIDWVWYVVWVWVIVCGMVGGEVVMFDCIGVVFIDWYVLYVDFLVYFEKICINYGVIW